MYRTTKVDNPFTQQVWYDKNPSLLKIYIVYTCMSAFLEWYLRLFMVSYVIAILTIDKILSLLADWFSFRADGHWSDWMHWSSCSATCGIGTKTRSRICNNPAPLNGEKNCFGNVSEKMQYCVEAICHGLFLVLIFLFLYLRQNSMYQILIRMEWNQILLIFCFY